MQALYVHIPFCRKKCFYCSFAVAVNQEHRVDQYIACLQKELGRYAGNGLRTIYFGGGTPSLLRADQWERIFDRMKKEFDIAPDAEITVEMNPEDIDAAKATCFHQMGVSRVSLGAQTFDDQRLSSLGRCHGSQATIESFDILRKRGFSNISLDLIYGFPGQTQEELVKDLAAMTALGAEHLSLYALSIEQNSLFHIKNLCMPKADDQAEAYRFVLEYLLSKGYRQYEVSNFARPGYESKHNICYWTGKNYLGVGLGAHSHQDGRRSWNVSSLPQYMQKIEGGSVAQEGEESLDPSERVKERLLFGLRMNRGIAIAEVQKELNAQISDPLQKTIAECIQGGLLEKEGDFLRTTIQGRLVLDEICARLI